MTLTIYVYFHSPFLILLQIKFGFDWPSCFQKKLELSEDLTIAPLLSFLLGRDKQMTGNNAKLDLVNVDAHKKIGQILTICS